MDLLTGQFCKQVVIKTSFKGTTSDVIVLMGVISTWPLGLFIQMCASLVITLSLQFQKHLIILSKQWH